ncbi:MAG: cell division protein FtsZ [Bacteroidales bacterium]|nr:cell division protein FtsZ [Bacteroidales bacterium]MBR6414899.1 cell division protein FtsZ [Bacteroidales bacterium]
MTDFTSPDIVDMSWVPENSMIKVIGVGGGGCNAVNYMYKQKIQGCNFIVCNTDSQALQKSEVPTKIQLGEGLGAGTNPTKGRNAALESQDLIAEKVLDNGTQMLFITAGMGGGTGTGASPVIAKMAKDRGILTVAVVTLPFKNEGDDFLSKAVDGIHELEKNVDSLLIINNEKLYEHFGNQLVQEAFPRADEVLATAVRGIIEIITKAGYVNVDFEDVKTMMKNSGMALMGCGSGSGSNRLEDAVKGALESPLLNDFDLKTSKNLLINITAGNNDQGLRMDELNRLNEMITEYTGKVNKFKRGLIYDDDPNAGDTIRITAIATGFKMNLINITGSNVGKLILIPRDFKYEDRTDDIQDGEISLTEEVNINKVGFNTMENKKKFHYDEKPVLILEPGQSKSELEATAAIRRVQRHHEN